MASFQISSSSWIFIYQYNPYPVPQFSYFSGTRFSDKYTISTGITGVPLNYLLDSGGHDLVRFSSDIQGIYKLGNVIYGAGTPILVAAEIEEWELTSSDDVFTGLSHGETVFGGNGNDVILAGGGRDLLVGGAGADTLDGGAGRDRVSYENAGSQVALSLGTGVGTRGDAAGDSIQSIEDATGSRFNDFIEGSDQDNFLYGGSGNDTLYGLGGNDRIFGGEGNDTIWTGRGFDPIDALSTDVVEGGAGDDIIVVHAGNNGAIGGVGRDTFILAGSGRTELVGDNFSVERFSDTFVFEVLGEFKIRDFDVGLDVMNLSALGVGGADISIVQGNEQEAVGASMNDVVVFLNDHDGYVHVERGHLNGFTIEDIQF